MSEPKGPATPEEAARVLDLRELPLYAGSEEPGGRSVARLTYTAKGSAPDVFAFHKKALVDRKWKELPGGYESPDSTSGTFTRGSFTLSLSASSLDAGGDKPEVMVSAVNHGNVNLQKLPMPPGAASLYNFPVTAAYVTAEPVEATAKAVSDLLIAEGWEPYGRAGDSRYFKQNGVKLSATVMVAPAQGGKTVIQLGTEQLSAILPVPADALRVQYSEPPTQLAVHFKGDLEQADAWYRERLAKLGWKPTTEKPVKQSFEYLVIYRNKPGAMLEITFREVEDFTRLLLEYTTPEEFAAMEKRWEEEEKKAAEKNQQK